MLAIRPIPAFADNYIWLLSNTSGAAAVVDPGEAAPVLRALHENGLRLTAILVTHHHADHIGGLAALRAAFPEARVHGPRDPRIRQLTDPAGEGERIALPDLDVSFRVLEVPGHTSTHIAWISEASVDPPWLFCGDTLFGAGCGRVFDGTFAQLADSLDRLALLAPDTMCYCAHEYTMDNLGFAQWVEPDRPAIAARLAEAQAQRARGLPTVPAPLALELATNPFLRTREPAVIAAAERFAGHPLAPGAAVFRALREWKDRDYD